MRAAAKPSASALLVVVLLLAGCTGAQVDDNEAAAQDTAGTFGGPAVPEGAYRLDGDFSYVLTPGPLAPLPPQIIRLQSAADGARIEFPLILPDAPEGARFPVILEASPYFFDGNSPVVEDEFSYRRFVENFLPHGYAVALLPVRGTANQGGCADVMGPLERADLDQVVTWLGTQPWSNGNVGMIGLSYSGATAWEVASVGNPHLKTIVPIAGVNHLHDLMYRNGSHEGRGSGRFMVTYYATRGPLEFNPAENNRDADAFADMLVCPELPRAFAASAHATVATGEDPLGFWSERNARPGTEKRYNGSIFLVQGLQDWNVDPAHAYPWINALEARGIVVKHMLGQWDHRWPDSVLSGAPPSLLRMDFAESLLRWFDHWLKEDATRPLGARVEVQDNAHQWRAEDAWPPHDATPLRLHLAPGGKLATDASATNERVLVGPAPFKTGELATERPEFDVVCAACARFVSEPMQEQLRVAGLPPLPLTVIPTAPFGHVAAWLYVVEGDATTIAGWGQIDLRFAAGDGKPRDVTPGEPLVARLQLEPLDLVVPPGARLALILHQGSYGDHTVSAPTAPIQLEVGGDASFLQLPTIMRDGSTFFTPPGAT